MEGFADRGQGGRSEDFVISPDPESAAARPEFESLNVCRVAALSALLSREPAAIDGVASALEEMGFPPALATGRRGLDRASRAELSDRWRMDAGDESRVALWASTQTEAGAGSGSAFLLAVLACSDFDEWSKEIAPRGLRSVFGHSYGGEVAARAVLEEVPIGELVLLSTPVTEHVVAAVEQGVRVVDVRLHFDPVLALARTGQKLPSRANVTTVRLKRWTLDHSATHDEGIWAREDIAARAGM